MLPSSTRLAVLPGLLLVRLLALSPPAAAGAAWPRHRAPAGAACAACVFGGLERGGTGAFGASPRDLRWLGAELAWSPVDSVLLRGRWRWLDGSWPDGHTAAGPGDLELESALRVAAPGPLPAAWLSWRVKLPDAGDESGLGTDETDVEIAAWLRWERGGWTLTGGGGLAVLGDPLHFAAQDDAPVALVQSELVLGPAILLASAGGRFPSALNPADLRLTAGVETAPHGGSWRVGGDVSAGLAPAAPGFSGSLWVARRLPCPALSK